MAYIQASGGGKTPITIPQWTSRLTNRGGYVWNKLEFDVTKYSTLHFDNFSFPSAFYNVSLEITGTNGLSVTYTTAQTNKDIDISNETDITLFIVYADGTGNSGDIKVSNIVIS